MSSGFSNYAGTQVKVTPFGFFSLTFTGLYIPTTYRDTPPSRFHLRGRYVYYVGSLGVGGDAQGVDLPRGSGGCDRPVRASDVMTRQCLLRWFGVTPRCSPPVGHWALPSAVDSGQGLCTCGGSRASLDEGGCVVRFRSTGSRDAPPLDPTSPEKSLRSLPPAVEVFRTLCGFPGRVVVLWLAYYGSPRSRRRRRFLRSRRSGKSETCPPGRRR